VLTLAPTVTFWDAGELIASIHNLGIPHPPGTPLFVLLGHVWAALFPVGEYAWRTNLMSATFSAAAAGFFFLVAHETLRRGTTDLAPGTRQLVALGGGMAASVGRLRPCALFDFKFVTLSHNTVRGAAGGAILLAELALAVTR